MANIQAANRNLLRRVQDLLRRKPNSYDVVFCVGVGPAQKIVKAVRILLEAASPALETKFKDWDDANVRAGSENGIPIPDFDSEAFEVFVRLTMLDEWTAESLKNLKLQPGQILNLISICREYEMEAGLIILEEMMTSFFDDFSAFKNTEDFLHLSYAHLQTILSSDNLPIKETDVFDCACRWAKAECAKRKIAENSDNLRLVLGDCIFEIRFPLMTAKEFTQCINQHRILTPAEGFETLNFIVSNETLGLVLDASVLPSKTEPRATPVQSQKDREIKPKFSILGLVMNSSIVDTPPYVCDEKKEWIPIATRRRILVHGLGFLGPIDGDAIYDVAVQFRINKIPQTFASEAIKKQICAQKGKVFRLMFDHPITLDEGCVEKWSKNYIIDFSLKGPNTQSFQRNISTVHIERVEENEFRLGWRSNQLAEILYTNM